MLSHTTHHYKSSHLGHSHTTVYATFSRCAHIPDGHVFTSKAAWRNKWTYYAMVFSTGIAFFVTHTPGVQYVLGSNTFPLWILAVPVGVGFAHLLFESTKRRVQRARAAAAATSGKLSKNSSINDSSKVDPLDVSVTMTEISSSDSVGDLQARALAPVTTV
eukprot:6800-Heterococcus_DN1.PRE.3